MSADLDCIVAGAGVIGLAIGRRLAMAGLQVAVLESEAHIGMHSSSRNSEVIHAGIYYPTASLKARLCVAGKALMYAYCAEKNIPHKNIGKLIVATNSSEETKLAAIEKRARANGVVDVRRLDEKDIAELEPEIRATAGLFSPSTGIVDSHGFMLSLEGDLQSAGGSVVLRSTVTGVRFDGKKFDVEVDGKLAATSRLFVNSAGLWASQLAERFDGIADYEPAQTRFARGHYFAYAGRSPFSHLIYPVPAEGGLGIHATNDLSGAARFGPDVQWIDAIDYSFPDDRLSRFVEAIQTYFPGLDTGKLRPDYTGIRPKLSKPGEAPADFGIEGPSCHGVAGLVNLYGMESPALTASLAIADHVYGLLVPSDP